MDNKQLKKQIIKNIDFFEQHNYLHLDKSLNKQKKRELLIRWFDPKLVAKHQWLPFIQFYIKKKKFDGSTVHTKLRKITLSAHVDSLLFKYYSEILIKRYENYLQRNDLSDQAIAYRKKHSSLLGAKQVFEYISTSDSCWIIKGDFEHFFDNIRHKKLKQKLSKVLLNSSEKPLPSDWYNVLIGVEKYRFVSKKKIEKFGTNKIDSKFKGAYFNNLGEFNKARRQGLNLSPKNRVGIPQGIPISGVLANIYMIDFDKFAQRLALDNNGIYKRYSDDFILVIPNSTYEQASTIKDKLIKEADDGLNLTIEDSKTRLFHYENNKVYVENSHRTTLFTYLGISFSGRKITLSDKNFYRFFYRGKRQILNLAISTNALLAVKNGKEDEWLANVDEKYQKKAYAIINQIKVNNINNIPYRRKITNRYLSTYPIKRKNFLDYAMKAQKIFEQLPPNSSKNVYEVSILHDTRRRIAEEGRYFNKLKDLLRYDIKMN